MIRVLSAVAWLVLIGFAPLGCGGNDTGYPGDTETASDSDGAGPYSRDPLCGQERALEIAPIRNDLVVVLERSGLDMVESGFSGVIYDSVVEFALQMENWLDLALLVHPDPSCETLLEQEIGTLCATSESLVVPFETASPGQEFDQTLGGWHGLGVCGLPAPTQALAETLAYLGAAPAQSEADVLFVTSGLGYCNDQMDETTCVCRDGVICNGSSPENCLDDVANTSDVIGDLLLAGHRTHVLLAQESSAYQAVGDAWATAGGTTRSYWAQTAGDEVYEQLDLIRQRLHSCRFAVDWASAEIDTVTAETRGLVNVFYDDKPLAYDGLCDPGIGWYWEDDTTIALCPETCEILSDANVLASLIFDGSYSCDSTH